MIYKIEIKANSPGNTVDVFIDGYMLDPKHSQKIRNHSSDGFNVGYLGSGPAQCALGILSYVVTPTLAQALYQQFKEQHVSRWQVNETYYIDIEEWVANC